MNQLSFYPLLSTQISSYRSYEEAYRDIADKLELPGRDNPKADILRLVRNWLCDERNGQWTMILDNVDDVETFFPSRKCEQGEPSESPSASRSAETVNPEVSNLC